MDIFPSLKDIELASERISSFIHRTPVLTNASINRFLDAEVYFKCENLQKVGAFKFRGATNAVLSLTADEAKNGVATHSSGNHAAALALAARQRDIKAFIVMPKNSSEIKKKAVKGYGAKIFFCDPTQQAREETLDEVVNQTEAIFIHPYNNYKIISGQATACLELMEEVHHLDIIIAPVSGGGLLSGTALSAAYISPGTEIIGAEPEGADDAFRSLQRGEIVPCVHPNTIADGLRSSLGTLTFPIIKKYVDRIMTTNDEYIVEAMRLIWERMKLIVEPSSAIALAILLSQQKIARNKKIGIILSGGNVDLDNLPW